jgi:hypothetical protein
MSVGEIFQFCSALAGEPARANASAAQAVGGDAPHASSIGFASLLAAPPQGGNKEGGL